MTKTLQLAQSKFTPGKLGDSVYVSEKLDGVPIRMDFTVEPDSVKLEAAVTRQGEHSFSTQFIQTRMANMLFGKRPGSYTFVGEVTHENYTDFKDVSGIVRRQEPQMGLIYNIFDFVDHAYPQMFFGLRIFAAAQLLQSQRHTVRFIPQIGVSRDQIEDWFAANLPKGAEGGIVRDYFDTWQPGKRTWGYQKYVQDPTIDLRLHSVEEATSEAGVPLGMAGRLNFWYKQGSIGVGPGKLSHHERTSLWVNWKNSGMSRWEKEKGPMACIQHKRDDSYEALRQPTFQHWRDDKDTPDA